MVKKETIIILVLTFVISFIPQVHSKTLREDIFSQNAMLGSYFLTDKKPTIQEITPFMINGLINTRVGMNNFSFEEYGYQDLNKVLVNDIKEQLNILVTKDINTSKCIGMISKITNISIKRIDNYDWHLSWWEEYIEGKTKIEQRKEAVNNITSYLEDTNYNPFIKYKEYRKDKLTKENYLYKIIKETNPSYPLLVILRKVKKATDMSIEHYSNIEYGNHSSLDKNFAKRIKKANQGIDTPDSNIRNILATYIVSQQDYHFPKVINTAIAGMKNKNSAEAKDLLLQKLSKIYNTKSIYSNQNLNYIQNELENFDNINLKKKQKKLDELINYIKKEVNTNNLKGRSFLLKNNLIPKTKDKDLKPLIASVNKEMKIEILKIVKSLYYILNEKDIINKKFPNIKQNDNIDKHFQYFNKLNNMPENLLKKTDKYFKETTQNIKNQDYNLNQLNKIETEIANKIIDIPMKNNQNFIKTANALLPGYYFQFDDEIKSLSFFSPSDLKAKNQTLFSDKINNYFNNLNKLKPNKKTAKKIGVLKENQDEIYRSEEEELNEEINRKNHYLDYNIFDLSITSRRFNRKINAELLLVEQNLNDLKDLINNILNLRAYDNNSYPASSINLIKTLARQENADINLEELKKQKINVGIYDDEYIKKIVVPKLNMINYKELQKIHLKRQINTKANNDKEYQQSIKESIKNRTVISKYKIDNHFKILNKKKEKYNKVMAETLYKLNEFYCLLKAKQRFYKRIARFSYIRKKLTNQRNYLKLIDDKLNEYRNQEISSQAKFEDLAKNVYQYKIILKIIKNRKLNWDLYYYKTNPYEDVTLDENYNIEFKEKKKHLPKVNNGSINHWKREIDQLMQLKDEVINESEEIKYMLKSERYNKMLYRLFHFQLTETQNFNFNEAQGRTLNLSDIDLINDFSGTTQGELTFKETRKELAKEIDYEKPYSELSDYQKYLIPRRKTEEKKKYYKKLQESMLDKACIYTNEVPFFGRRTEMKDFLENYPEYKYFELKESVEVAQQIDKMIPLTPMAVDELEEYNINHNNIFIPKDKKLIKQYLQREGVNANNPNSPHRIDTKLDTPLVSYKGHIITFKDIYIEKILQDDEQAKLENKELMNKLLKAVKVENNINIKRFTYDVNKQRLENFKIYFKIFDNKFKNKLSEMQNHVNYSQEDIPYYIRNLLEGRG